MHTLPTPSVPRFRPRRAGLLTFDRALWILVGIVFGPAATVVLISTEAIAAIHRVPSEFSTIQAGIDAAESGDTVLVAPGTYLEGLHISNQYVSLLSEGGRDSTVLDGELTRRILRIDDSNVAIRGFTFFRGASSNGGGICAVDVDLLIEDCTFRENLVQRTRIHELGGGIFLSRNSRASVRYCTFIKNTSDRFLLSQGTSIAYQPRDWSTDGAGGNWEEWDVRLEIDRCSFLHDEPHFGSVIALHDWFETRITHSVFVTDRPWGRGSFILGGRSNLWLECTSFWNGSSPQVADFGSQARNGQMGSCSALDPRLCPDDPESVHESSPLLSCGGCGPIGDLSVGCSGPVVLGLREPAVNPIERKTLRVYGYGLDAVDRVELVSPTGQIRTSASLGHYDAWMTISVDLSGAEAGTWAAHFLRDAKPILEVAEFVDVLPFVIYAFKDPWISAAGVAELDLAQAGWRQSYELELVHAESEVRTMLEIRDYSDPDTLRCSADLSESPEGLYDLEVTTPNLKTVRVASMLHLGTPVLVRVPQDHPTLSEAIAHAPAGARIEIADGDYLEEIVIDRPLQIVGLGSRTQVRLLPPAGADTRVIHVLESAGRITRLEGLRIENGRPSSGSGGGVLAETPISVVDCYFSRNHLASNGSGGGAFLAPGSQVLRSRFRGNSAAGVEDRWVAVPFGADGVAGGLYCEHCRVDQCEFGGNSAGCSGGAVVSGLFRDNLLDDNWARSFRGHIEDLAVQGEVLRNRFERGCGSSAPPTVCIFGSSQASYNTFTDFWADMCDALSLVALLGPVEFSFNSLAGVGLQVCTGSSVSEPDAEDEIRIYGNLIDSRGAHGPSIGYCNERFDDGPVQSVNPSRISASCNLGSPFRIYSPTGEIPCPNCVHQVDPGFCEIRYTDGYYSYGEFNLRLREDSPALPENSPLGCVDTLGALPAGCEVSPVLVAGARISLTDAGVELRWSMLEDAAEPVGFHLLRHQADEPTRITESPLAPCVDCVFVDRDGQTLSGQVSYELIILWGESEEHFFLGSIDLDHETAVELGSPRPNPMQVDGYVSFALPHAMDVALELFDVGGRAVRTLHSGFTEAGVHQVPIQVGGTNQSRLGSGIYWVRLRAGREIRQTRLIVIP